MLSIKGRVLKERKFGEEDTERERETVDTVIKKVRAQIT